MDFNKILINYKTSSAGILLIIGAIVSITYSVTQTGEAPAQSELMGQITAIFAGVGLLLSRDVDKSTEATNGHKEMEDAGERINNE